MKRWLPGMLVPLVLAGCASPPAAPAASAGDPRVVLAPGLAISAEEPIIGSDNGLARVVVRLSNATDQDIPVLSMTEWTDAAARPVRSVMSRPRRLTVPRFGEATVDSLAPSAGAVGFRVSIEPDMAD